MKRAKDVKRRTAEIRQEHRAQPDPTKKSGFAPLKPKEPPPWVVEAMNKYAAYKSLYP